MAAPIPGWSGTEEWTPVGTFLATWAPLEAWPEIEDGAMVTPQTIETAMRRLPWKAASDSSCKLAGRLGWLLATGLRALHREVVALRSKIRELEKEVGTLQDAKLIAQEVITLQAERCYGLQDNVERLVARIANKQRDKYGKSKVSISQVRALITKRSWDPEEWDGNIQSESSDSETEFEFDLDLKGREVVEAQPLIQTMGQQEQADGGVQITRTYSPKELREFLEIYQQKSGEGILAWILRAWDSGAASIHLIAGEKDLLSPIANDGQIQRGYAQLQNVRGPDGRDVVAPTLYQWLCAAVLTAYAEPVELVSSLGSWCTIEEGINVVWQMGMAHALVAGSNPDSIAVTRSIKMQFLRGAPASLKPLIIPAVTNATGNIGALADTLRDIGDVISGPSVQAVNKGKAAKAKGVTSGVTRKQMWNDLVRAGVPRSEIDGITTSEMFCRWQKLGTTQKSQLALVSPPTPRPPSTPSCHLKATYYVANAKTAETKIWQVPQNC